MAREEVQRTFFVFAGSRRLTGDLLTAGLVHVKLSALKGGAFKTISTAEAIFPYGLGDVLQFISLQAA